MLLQGSIAILYFIGLIFTSTVFAASTINPVQAETGIGPDIFKVLMTIFDVDETKGDVVAVVTVKNEAAKVKLFDASGPEVVPLNASEGGGHIIEYIATFPNVTVNSGDPYKACIFTVKDLELICKSGNNSPAARPEFIDLSLNTTTSGLDESTVEDGDGDGDGDENIRDESDRDENGNEGNADTPDLDNEGTEGETASPGTGIGVPPTG
jgi:hypothetical protein